MNISKPVKILIGVLTVFAVLFPFIIMPAFVMYFMFSSAFPFFNPQSIPNPQDIAKTMLPMMMVFYPTMMCFSLVQIGLQIFYIIHEIKNKSLTDTFRILFAIGTFFLSFVAMPIYFIAYLWKDNAQELKSSSAELPA
jgi:hypothetical protein